MLWGGQAQGARGSGMVTELAAPCCWAGTARLCSFYPSRVPRCSSLAEHKHVSLQILPAPPCAAGLRSLVLRREVPEVFSFHSLHTLPTAPGDCQGQSCGGAGPTDPVLGGTSGSGRVEALGQQGSVCLCVCVFLCVWFCVFVCVCMCVPLRVQVCTQPGQQRFG